VRKFPTRLPPKILFWELLHTVGNYSELFDFCLRLSNLPILTFVGVDFGRSKGIMRSLRAALFECRVRCRFGTAEFCATESTKGESKSQKYSAITLVFLGQGYFRSTETFSSFP
jgi:hypothetical protein